MLNKIWNGVRRTGTSISGIGCIMICFCIAAQIFCRYFMGISLKWSEELAEVAMIFMVFMALAEVEHGNEHLQVEILFTIFPKLSFAMSVVGKALTLAYTTIIMYSGYLMLPAVQRATAKASKFPIRYLYYAMLIGVGLWMIQTVINLVKIICERRKSKA